MIRPLAYLHYSRSGTALINSPTPPEPRITILYSRILEILADYSYLLFSRWKIRLMCTTPSGVLWWIVIHVRWKEKLFESLMMIHTFFSFAVLVPFVVARSRDSLARCTSKRLWFTWWPQALPGSSLASPLRRFMQCYSALKTCTSTPRYGEKKKMNKNWEWNHVGMTSVWTCGAD
jgi:hypothetical protein